ncbi:cell division protein FtsQ/DivIB [Cardinium endosymbiont of Culicoides punctatus]|uniref:cell division protein FtsQ/DivIB n=1 Tax=Cardinium endosymbiont of Culicoides punctatus TaxID=2304601 RepID=UPI00105897DC|nr:hypothetical protein [Cardinium endosymbiont of Culicoides punctatus]TDG93256.1 hypothetical protein CCPUN_09110 [Cardinium endosymbiont of Culicoides punctatus]
MEKIAQIAKSILAFFLTLCLCLSLLIADKQYQSICCKNIDIQIKKNNQKSFVTEKVLLHWIQSTHEIPLIGTPLNKINSYRIKKQLESQPLIKDVLIYKTWSGRLKIIVEIKYLIARIIDTSKPNHTHLYIDEYGDLIVIKEFLLLRLLIVGGNLQNIAVEKNGKQFCKKELLGLLHALYEHPFLSRQVTSLEVDEHDKIVLGTQIGNHRIELGRAQNIHPKLDKLLLFYSQVIPYKGWHAYKRVNLEFEQQLVCE